MHVQAVLRVLLERGAQVDLLCARVGGEVPPGLAAVRVHQLPTVTGAVPAEREASAKISDAAVGPLLSRLAAGHRVDLVYERYALWGRSGMPWAAANGTRGVLEINAPLVQEQARHRGLIDRLGAERVAATAIGSASAAVCVTAAVAKWARTRTTRQDRVHVVPNGVDTDRILPAERPVAAAAADPFVVGFVGTLKPWHGVDTLVGAMALLIAGDPSYRLLLVGDGPEAAQLTAAAERLGIADAVRMTGAVDPIRIPELLGQMDIACAPYPAIDDFYFSPLKVREYLAAGLPVVASRVGELPDVLDGGRLGSLVGPSSVTELAWGIARLRADVARRQELRVLGRAAALDHDWKHVVARTLGIIATPSRAPIEQGASGAR